LIAGVQIVPLRVIPDARGSVMRMLRADDPHFTAFGEVYFSCINPGVIKGWRKHTRMVQNLAVPVGQVEVALYDGRADSPTYRQVQDVIVGPETNYALVLIPPGVWNAFKGLGVTVSVVANCASILHDPAESETRPLDDPPVAFVWK
jgi:dTDP-4-dehydrorhamnose 3,5-epimerase